jgi:hypothetical protein
MSVIADKLYACLDVCTRNLSLITVLVMSLNGPSTLLAMGAPINNFIMCGNKVNITPGSERRVSGGIADAVVYTQVIFTIYSKHYQQQQVLT